MTLLPFLIRTRPAFLPAAACTLLASLAAPPAAGEAPRPNFVIIVADDLGYAGVGCYGSEANPTPRIDALAAEGMKFTDFHSNGAVCSPTRAALMTGRYQQRSGIGGVVTAAGHRDTGLALEETTFAELLQAAGYGTAIFGKWHLGYDPKYNPVHQGFDEFRGFVSGNVDYFSHYDQTGEFDWWHQDRLHREEGYVTHLITGYGVRYIAENKDRPFLLYLPHLAPHAPYQGPGDEPIRDGDEVLITAAEDVDIARAYREMMIEFDAGVGAVVDALEEHGLSERTLVLFFSDNGANQYGENGVFRGFKGQVWEGGHRVPAIARWPGTIPAGVVSDATALTMDLFPTLLEAAGVAAPGGLDLDGESLLPLLTGAGNLAERTVFWHTGRGAAARRGPWKYVEERPRGGGEPVAGLYHLGEDPGETSPVDNPEVAAELKAALESWKESWAHVEQRS